MIQLLQKTVSKYREDYWEGDIIFLLTISLHYQKTLHKHLSTNVWHLSSTGFTDDLNTTGCKRFQPPSLSKHLLVLWGILAPTQHLKAAAKYIKG